MPSLDFTDVLTGDEFVDTFLVTVSRGLIGSGGLDVETPAPPVKVQGIVVPGRSSLLRTADGSRVTAFIEIYTAYRLSAGMKTNDVNHRDPDTVTWHGADYLIMTVDDYTGFGPGFVKASCDLIELNLTS